MMGDIGSTRSALVQSLVIPRSDSKKRVCEEVGDRSEIGQKRAKTRDLESELGSEGKFGNYISRLVVDRAPSALDLNAQANHLASDEVRSKLSSLGKQQEMDLEINSAKSRGFGLDLNAEDVSSSINHNPFHPYKSYEYLKSRDALSECGSTCGTSEDRDPMRVWKEMKQNGFLSSSSHGGVPVPMPKPRGRKSKNDGIRKKIEIAKREQVDRFAKIAAPSGLLNELNPGIINHVRNSKQVHAIIEALVRSERSENRKHAIQTKTVTQEFSERKDLENMSGSETNSFNHCHGDGYWQNSHGSSMCPLDELTGDDDSGMTERAVFAKTTCPADPNLEFGDDILMLKLSSSVTMASENMSSLTNEESGNITTVTSLSVKAANVASQWLELLHQEIKGRLAALRRSKKRVRAVIQTELPFLLSRELSSNQENDPYLMRSSETGCSDKATADLHRARWSALFDQMDKSLSEEERHLENSLTHVKEMLIHCEHGLLKYNSMRNLQHLAMLENEMRNKKDDTAERDLAVRASAAAIYSTCNFLQSMENVPCVRVSDHL